MRIVPSICISPLKPTDRFNFTENKYKVVRFKMIYIYTKVLFSRYDLFSEMQKNGQTKSSFMQLKGLFRKENGQNEIPSAKTLRKLILGIFPKSRLLFLKAR